MSLGLEWDAVPDEDIKENQNPVTQWGMGIPHLIPPPSHGSRGCAALNRSASGSSRVHRTESIRATRALT